MTPTQWAAFTDFRDRFREQCRLWSASTGGSDGWLAELQKQAAVADHNPEYVLETPIVYNTSLDSLGPEDEIRLIVVGDNPGKDEQLQKNRRYLVGQAGKLGEGFFRRHGELGIDFRKNVIILNKTPIHTAKTKQLSLIRGQGGTSFTELFHATQQWMARETAQLRKALDCGLWLVGYGELRAKGLFADYAAELSRACAGDENVRLYQHFSMNRFSIDLAEKTDPQLTLAQNLERIGLAHRREILGW